MRCAAVAADGAVHHRAEADTPKGREGIAPLVDLMREVTSHAGCESAVVGVPGRVNYEHGRLEYAPNLPEGWVAALTESDLTGAARLPVSLANDADLAAVGETWFGAGQAHTD